MCKWLGQGYCTKETRCKNENRLFRNQFLEKSLGLYIFLWNRANFCANIAFCWVESKMHIKIWLQHIFSFTVWVELWRVEKRYHVDGLWMLPCTQPKFGWLTMVKIFLFKPNDKISDIYKNSAILMWNGWNFVKEWDKEIEAIEGNNSSPT